MVDETQAGSLSGLPAWAKGIAWIGAPVAAAGFLIYFLTQTLTTRLDALETDLHKHTSEMAATSAVTVEQNWQMIAVVQATCLNVAKTDSDRLRCLAVRPK